MNPKDSELVVLLSPWLKRHEGHLDKRGRPIPQKGGFDGVSFRPYASLEGGTRTIGYGQKLLPTDDASKMSWSPQEAEAALGDSIEKHAGRAREYVDARFGAGTFDNLEPKRRAVLTELDYNAGVNVFPRTTRSIVEGKLDEAAQGIRQRFYTTPSGVKQPLHHRNEATVAMLLGTEEAVPKGAAPFDFLGSALGSLRYKGRRGRMAQLHPVLLPKAPLAAPEPDFLYDLLPSAFRYENWSGAWLSKETLSGTADPFFDPFDARLNAGTIFEENPEYLVGLRSLAQWRDRKEVLDQEVIDFENLYVRGGVEGWIAGAALGLLSPEMLIPAAGLRHVGTSMLRGIAIGAGNTVLASTLSETGLQSMQMTRPMLATALNIGGAAFLGGVVGGSVGLVNKVRHAKLVARIDSELGKPRGGSDDPSGLTPEAVRSIPGAAAHLEQPPIAAAPRPATAGQLFADLTDGRTIYTDSHPVAGAPSGYSPLLDQLTGQGVEPTSILHLGQMADDGTPRVEFSNPSELAGVVSDHNRWTAKRIEQHFDESENVLPVDTIVPQLGKVPDEQVDTFLELQKFADETAAEDLAPPTLRDLDELEAEVRSGVPEADRTFDVTERIGNGTATLREIADEIADLEDSQRILRSEDPQLENDLATRALAEVRAFSMELRRTLQGTLQSGDVTDLEPVLVMKVRVNEATRSVSWATDDLAKARGNLDTLLSRRRGLTNLGERRTLTADIRRAEDEMRRKAELLYELEAERNGYIGELHKAMEDAVDARGGVRAEDMANQFPHLSLEALRDFQFFRPGELPELEGHALASLWMRRDVHGGYFIVANKILLRLEDGTLAPTQRIALVDLMRKDLAPVGGETALIARFDNVRTRALDEMGAKRAPGTNLRVIPPGSDDEPPTPRPPRGRRKPSYVVAEDGIVYIHADLGLRPTPDTEPAKAVAGMGRWEPIRSMGQDTSGTRDRGGPRPPSGGGGPPSGGPTPPPPEPPGPKGDDFFDEPPLPDPSVAAKEAVVDTWGVGEVLAKLGVSPMLRLAIASPFIRAKQIVQQLVNTHVVWVKNQDLIPTPMSIESRVYAHHTFVNWMQEEFQKSWTRYAMRVRGEAAREPKKRDTWRQAFSAKFRSKGEVMTLLQMDEMIGRSLRSGSTIDIPEMQLYTSSVRNMLLEYLKKAQEIGVIRTGGTPEDALKYLTRLWNKTEIKRRLGTDDGLEMRIADWMLEKERQRAAELTAANPNQQAQPRFDRQAAQEMALEVVYGILNTPHGRLSPFEHFFKGRPLNARVLDFDDDLVMDFLLHDHQRIVRFYVRTVTPDLEIGRVFRLPDHNSKWTTDPDSGLLRVVWDPRAKPGLLQGMAAEEFLDPTLIAGFGQVRSQAVLDALQARRTRTARPGQPAPEAPDPRSTWNVQEVQDLLAGGDPIEGVGPQLRQALQDVVSAKVATLEQALEQKIPGKPDLELEGPLYALRLEFEERLRQTPTPSGRETLYVQYAGAIRDITALRDRVRGTHTAGSDPGSMTSRVFRGFRRGAYAIQGGGFPFSAIPDLGRLVMVHGIERVYGDLIKAAMLDLRSFKMTAKEAKLAATAIDQSSRRSRLTLLDLGEEAVEITKFERVLQGGADTMAAISLLSKWTDWMKQLGTILTTQRIGEAALDLSRGIESKDLPLMAQLGLSPETMGRIAMELAQYGRRGEGGLLEPATELWTDLEAQTLFRHALRTHVDRTIVTPGKGDVPLKLDNEAWKTIFQYKGYGIAALNQVLVNGMQLRDAHLVHGMISATLIGMLVYKLKSEQFGFPTSNDPREWIKQGVDRSGIFGLLGDMNGALAGATRGHLSLGRLIGGPNTQQWTDRRLVSNLLGPSYSLAMDFEKVVAAAPAVLLNADWGKAHSEDVHAFRKLMAYNTLWYADFLFDWMEDGMKRAARESREAAEMAAPEVQP